MDNKDGGVPMQCTNCHKTATYSPLRLGRKCGQCKNGTWIPYKKEGEAMKDQHGKETTREIAPNKRNPADKYKVTVVPEKEHFDVKQDGKRPTVTKK